MLSFTIPLIFSAIANEKTHVCHSIGGVLGNGNIFMDFNRINHVSKCRMIKFERYSKIICHSAF